MLRMYNKNRAINRVNLNKFCEHHTQIDIHIWQSILQPINIYAGVYISIYYFRWYYSWYHFVINYCSTSIRIVNYFRWCDSWRHLGINICTTSLPTIYPGLHHTAQQGTLHSIHSFIKHFEFFHVEFFIPYE